MSMRTRSATTPHTTDTRLEAVLRIGLQTKPIGTSIEDCTKHIHKLIKTLASDTSEASDVTNLLDIISNCSVKEVWPSVLALVKRSKFGTDADVLEWLQAKEKIQQ